MTCKPDHQRTAAVRGLERQFQMTNLKREGRLQFFFHCPKSLLPIRDVIGRKRRSRT